MEAYEPLVSRGELTRGLTLTDEGDAQIRMELVQFCSQDDWCASAPLLPLGVSSIAAVLIYCGCLVGFRETVPMPNVFFLPCSLNISVYQREQWPWNSQICASDLMVSVDVEDIYPHMDSYNGHPSMTDVIHAISCASWLCLITMVCAAVSGRVRRQKPVKLSQVERGATKWFFLHTTIELAIVAVALSNDVVSWNCGMAPNMWVALACWHFSSELSEIILLGEVNAVKLVMRKLPSIGNAHTRVLKMVLVGLCFKLGDLFGAVCGLSFVMIEIVPLVILCKKYPVDLGKRYFVVSPAMTRSPLILPSLAGDALLQIEAMTQTTGFLNAYASAVHALVQTALMVYLGHFHMFMVLSCANDVLLVLGFIVARLAALSKLEDWRKLYDFQLLLWSSLITILSIPSPCRSRASKKGRSKPTESKAPTPSAWLLHCTTRMCRLLQQLDRHSEARTLCDEMLPISACGLGNHHVTSLTFAYFAASSSLKLAKSKEDKNLAVRLTEDVWTHAKQSLGDHHPLTLSSLNCFGNALRKTKRPAEAAVAFRKCWHGRSKLYSPMHDDAITAFNNYGSALRDLGQIPHAVDIHYMCWQLKCKVVGPLRPTTLNVMGSYAASLGKLPGCEEKVANLHQEAWLKKWMLLGRLHRDTLLAMRDYADALQFVPDRQEEASTVQQCFQDLSQCSSSFAD